MKKRKVILVVYPKIVVIRLRVTKVNCYIKKNGGFVKIYSNQYEDYYLVNEADVKGLQSKHINYSANSQSSPDTVNTNRMFFVLLLFVLLLLFLLFVVFPLVFMKSVSLQQFLVFTHWSLPTNKSYFEEFRFSGLRNQYITFKDVDEKKNLTLGLWHILPLSLAEQAIHDPNFDYNDALKNSKFGVILYFHGTGEDRSDNHLKYQLLRLFFHVIAFDYRSYGDSQKGPLFEHTVVNDCVQIYRWLAAHTNAPIYFWGHSLGTALATATLTQLNQSDPVRGLILEAPFTNLINEIREHPYVKYFAWLPWFHSTVARPLTKNGFVFNTAGHILNVRCPIMIFHAEDDEVVPYHMSQELYLIAKSRKNTHLEDDTILHLFERKLGYDHIFMYRDPYMIFNIIEFVKLCEKAKPTMNLIGSHQS